MVSQKFDNIFPKYFKLVKWRVTQKDEETNKIKTSIIKNIERLAYINVHIILDC